MVCQWKISFAFCGYQWSTSGILNLYEETRQNEAGGWDSRYHACMEAIWESYDVNTEEIMENVVTTFTATASGFQEKTREIKKRPGKKKIVAEF
ncbi:hypothetical protein RchiOBHm_Chr3g0471061 [Rosa chinensis]|uniref:Uncharacterized protein n=1 Tax=Rosa chinensis TaxID=74649 RepID=A0A2P6RB85_ROSCH|nr:hypothetical protein RchiOBHm_Chr3g0471061 [Rosa chinensis]